MWPVQAARLEPDGKTVFLRIPKLQPVMQLRVKFDLEALGGGKIKSDFHSSIHKLPTK